jgi:hypothetical protein
MAEPRSKLFSLVSHFESLTDPRALKARNHFLTDVMAIAVSTEGKPQRTPRELSRPTCRF